VRLRRFFLANGGAAIAMLGFVASMATGERGGVIGLIRRSSSVLQIRFGAGLARFGYPGFAYVVMYLQAAVASKF